jgi:hypothetical protein
MANRFNPTNYISCFYYLKGYVDVSQSSKLGQWYMTSKSAFRS